MQTQMNEFSGKLTWILSFEVANEADVFLHPLKGSQLHGVIDNFHWVLQHLGGDIIALFSLLRNTAEQQNLKH